MNDFRISATTAASGLLWTVGVVLTIVELVTGLDVGELGVVTAAGGAVLTVRGFFCQLADRERNAFELGRDYESNRIHPVP